MGVHYDRTRRKYTVRWQEGDRRRIRRFETEAEAVAAGKAVMTRDRGRPPSAGIELNGQDVDEAVADLGRARTGRRDAIYRSRFAGLRTGPARRLASR